MKIRKLLSAFMSVAMITSLLASFSVAHAVDVPTLTATTEYDSEKSWIVVTVSYSGFENLFNAYEDEGSVKGIAAISFDVVPNVPDDPEAEVPYKGGVKSTTYGCMNVGGVSTPTTGIAAFTFNASGPDAYLSQTEGTLCKFRFAADANAKVNFTITNPIIRVTEWTEWSMSTPVDYIGTPAITTKNASYGESAPVLADFTALNAAITAYESKTEADYTAASWATAKAAYEAATAINQETETDQAKVDAAAEALNDAIVALVEVKIKKDNPSGMWTFGFGGAVKTKEATRIQKIVFDFTDEATGETGNYAWELNLDTAINATVTYGLNIMNCPVNSDIKSTGVTVVTATPAE